MDILEIKDLTFSYPGAESPTLNNVQLNIEKGDFIAIVGNNGCGKSTLCKVMNGLIPHFIAGDFEGSVIANGVDTQTADIGDLTKIVGYVYQDFENQIVRPTVLDDASYACMNYGMADYLDRGRQALKDCGLEGKDGEYIWQLSGGQTHLLALAGAVSLEPEVLILDEPIAQLDPGHADRIYGILKDLNERLGKTIIVIEHHTEYIAEYCKHVVLLKDGHVEWMLPTKEALDRVDDLQECNIFPPQVTIAAHALKKQGKIPADEMLPSTVAMGKETFKDLYFVNPALRVPRSKGSEVSVSFRDVNVSYRSVKGEPRQIYKNLNLDLYKGEKIALIGSNGAGKST